jgi:hypothetical protein
VSAIGLPARVFMSGRRRRIKGYLSNDISRVIFGRFA